MAPYVTVIARSGNVVSVQSPVGRNNGDTSCGVWGGSKEGDVEDCLYTGNVIVLHI